MSLPTLAQAVPCIDSLFANASRYLPKRQPQRRSQLARLIGNYLTTDQVLAVGGIQFQSEPLRKRNHLVELRMLHHATVTMSR